PTDVGLSTAFAALLQALCSTALADGAAPAPDPARRGDYVQNRWAAARFGPAAQLIHPDGTRVGLGSELGAELLDLVTPAAEELGTVDLVRRIDPAACAADLQAQNATAREAG